MDKEEAIKILKNFHDKSALFSVRTALEILHPELAESEDEKKRKAIIELVKQSSEVLNEQNQKEMLAWLEKQGQKPKKVSIWKHWKDGIAGNGEGKPIYLIKDGDAYRISSVLGCECDYIELSDLDELILQKSKANKIFDKIQLGKKYKCIASPRYTTFMIGEIYKPEDKFLCSLMNFCYDCFEPIEDIEQKVEPKFKVGDEIKTDNEDPLTITKIDEQGYWSEDLFICSFDDSDKWELVEPAEWNEEDMKEALRTEYEKGRADAFAEMQVAWSEEDENKIDTIISVYRPSPKLIKWLKSIKQRYTWKPSGDQMKALTDALSLAKNCGEERAFDLRTLYEDLKKLKGE